MSFVDQGLAARLELASAWRAVNYVRARAALEPGCGADVLHTGGGYAVYGGAGSPVCRAAGLGMAGPVSPADLDAVEAFFAARGAAPAVDLCPLADESLLALLRERGYRPSIWFSIVYAPLPLAIPIDPAVQVELAGPADADLWLRTVGAGFVEGAEPDPATIAAVTPNFYAPAGACYLARVDGEPAGGGGAYEHGGAVELGGASTHPRFRRRGVQRSLIARRLADAAAAGCDLALSLTEPGSASQRNLERHGFRLAYNRLTLTRAS